MNILHMSLVKTMSGNVQKHVEKNLNKEKTNESSSR